MRVAGRRHVDGVIFGDVASAGGTNGVGAVGGLDPAARSVRLGVAELGDAGPGPEPDGQRLAPHDPSSPGDAAGSVVLTPRRRDGHLDPGDPAQPRAARSRAGGSPASSPAETAGRSARVRSSSTSSTSGRGVNDIRADVSFANDPSDPVGEYLVNPDGDTVGYGQNSVEGHQRHVAVGLHGQPRRRAVDADRRLRRRREGQRDLPALPRANPSSTRRASGPRRPGRDARLAAGRRSRCRCGSPTPASRRRTTSSIRGSTRRRTSPSRRSARHGHAADGSADERAGVARADGDLGGPRRRRRRRVPAMFDVGAEPGDPAIRRWPARARARSAVRRRRRRCSTTRPVGR